MHMLAQSNAAPGADPAPSHQNGDQTSTNTGADAEEERMI